MSALSSDEAPSDRGTPAADTDVAGGLNRREFLRGAATAGALIAAPMILPSRLFGQNAPSRKIGLGLVGCGSMAQLHIKTIFGFDDVRLLAVCDVDRVRREAAVETVNRNYGDRSCASTGDFRELVARPDVDAVFVCTPDNWHALVAIEAVRHGKDVYVEKPLTLTLREGRELVNAARAHQRAVQTGTQQRSSRRFHDPVEFVRNGGLGRLERIEILIPPNNRFCGATWQPEPVPEGLDWDMWLGPAPWRPFNRHGCHYAFRFVLDYALGQVTNWGTHYIDIAQWALAMDESGPVEIEGRGEYPTSGLYSTATRVDFTCRYASGVKLSCRTRYDGIVDGGITFHGERGWIAADRESLTASEPAILREVRERAGGLKLPVSRNHHGNFFDCIRTRARPISDVAIGHRSTSVCILGNIAMRLDRKVRWDPAREEFPDDPMANRLLARAMRGPWSLV